MIFGIILGIVGLIVLLTGATAPSEYGGRRPSLLRSGRKKGIKNDKSFIPK